MNVRIMAGIGITAIGALLATWYFLAQAMVMAESFALVMCQ